MPCPCVPNPPNTICINDGQFSVEFRGLANLNGTTVASYELCLCATPPGISHVDFEICPPGVGPQVDVTTTVGLNAGLLEPQPSGVEFPPPEQGVPPRVRLNFAQGVFEEPGDCRIVQIAYTGNFTQNDLIPSFVRITGGGTNFPPGEILGLTNCEAVECPNPCDCDDFTSDYTVIIPDPTLDTDCFVPGDLSVTFCSNDLTCVAGTCEVQMDIEVCDVTLEDCCIEVDTLTVSGTVEVALTRPYTGGCLEEGETICQTNIGRVNVNAVCFFCPGTGPTPTDCDICDLINEESITITPNPDGTVTVGFTVDCQ